MSHAETPAVTTPVVGAAAAPRDAVPRLEVRGLSKTFSGVTVLDDARLALAPGEIHALVGQNGSGKSTLIKLISGVYRPDPGGEVLVDAVHLGPPIHAGRLHHQGLAFVHQDHGLVPDRTLRQNLRYGGITTSNQYLDASLNADGHTVDRSTTGVYEHMNSLAVDTALESRFRTGALSHALTLGVDYSRFGGNIRYLSGSAPSIDMWSPNYNQTIASPDTLLSNQDVEGRQTGVYANDQVNWDNWRLSLGLRRDSVTQTQRELSTNASSSQKDSATSGSVGLLYLINDTWAPYVSYATSFNPQFGVNLAGEAFKPTEGKMWEAGLKYQPVDGNAMVTLSVFDLVQQNVKTRDPNNVLNQVQTGEVSSRGVELESVLNLKGGLNLVGSYTWQDLEVTRSNDGNQGKAPVGKPEQMAALWAKYKVEGGTLAGLDLGLGARRIGRSYADSANSRENAGYTLVDARIGYELKQLAPGVTLAINATNLTDKEYLMCHDGYCYRGRGRSVIGSLNYRW